MAEEGQDQLIIDIPDSIMMTDEYWIILAAWCEGLRELIIDILSTIADALCIIWIMIKRASFATKLSKWMPGGLAHFIAWHWPERWLPMPEIEEEAE